MEVASTPTPATPTPVPAAASQTTKKTKIKRVLKSAARLPLSRPRVSALRSGLGSGSGSGRNNNYTPRPGEPPVVLFRLQVLGCMGVLVKDRAGSSDPFVVVSVLNKKDQTPVAKKTVNPIWAAKDATFDFPIYLSLADRLGAVELVVWDKDMLSKDYLGEVAIPLEDWFVDKEGREREFGFDQLGNQPFSVNLVSTRANTPSAGSIQIKLGFAPTPNAQNLMEFDEIYGELVKRSRPSLVSAPPTEGVGTVRSNNGAQYQYQDDGGLSSESEDSDDEAELSLGPSASASASLDTATTPPLSRSPAPGLSLSSGSGSGAGAGAKPFLDIYIPPSSSIDLSTPYSTTASTTSTSTSSSASALTTPGSWSSAVDSASASELSAHPSNIPTGPTLAMPMPIPTPGGTGGTGGTGKAPVGLPELSISPGTPATPTPGNLPTAMPRFQGVGGGAGGAEDTPKAVGFALPPVSTSTTTPTGTGTGVGSGVGLGIGIGTPPSSTTSTSSSSRFIPNPKKFVRKISGLKSGSGGAGGQLGGGGLGPASPAVDAQGNLVPPSSPGGNGNGNGNGKKEKDKDKDKDLERRKFGRSWSSTSSKSQSRDGSVSPSPSASGGSPSASGSEAVLGTGLGPAGAGAEGRKRIGRRKKKDYEFTAEGGNDIVGIVMLEIEGADDLPRLANMTRTGWDMDPFVVISFGKKVFRTRVIRHSRNPVWDEKLLFHVRRYETAFKVQLTILDWDKLSANDHICETSFDVKELIEGAPQPDGETGLYVLGEEQGEGGEGKGGRDGEGMRGFRLPLKTERGMPWEARHAPVIRFRAKYQPYDALRQRFWRQYLKQYDTDDSNEISHLELTAMLDSLGSTLTRSTISSFFTRYGKTPPDEEITIDQAVICLEEELGRPDEEKKRVDADDGLADSVSATPVMMVADSKGGEVQLDLGKMDFSGPMHAGGGAGEAYATEPMRVVLGDAAAAVGPGGAGSAGPGVGLETPDLSSDDAEGDVSSGSGVVTPGDGAVAPAQAAKRRKLRFRRASKKGSTDSQAHTHPLKESSEDSITSEGSNPIERVINVKNCPLCHRPRLNSKAEIDIVTHLAICASQDWNTVDRIVVGNFVTASQAQRKWYTKILSKVSSGDYKLGANSANIIVQNRVTGQLEEEKMQVYVRLGIRLLYKGASSRMEGGKARRLLKSLSIKQGIKYDDPESAKEIPAFIDFHGLKVDEILDPLDSFKTFNQFFYRKLKPSARPIESPDDPYRLVSAADCRLMTFETVSEATRLWIKGREFTVARLLGDAYKGQAERYTGGALAIFRLAPQDYHRFHSPVEGRIGEMTYIAGEYYTVNPQAIRTALDVYGENARKIVPIDSPQFGRVMAVCVGAMMVGSIKTTVEEGGYVQKGQEFGYFAFGGSTIVILFEKGRVEWDEDLLINGRAALETLVRVGMGIGKGRPADA